MSYRRWITTRATALDEIKNAHASVGGTRRGRRYATQQINQSYAVMIASQFQGFCRDIHFESVEHLITMLAPSGFLKPLVLAEFTRGRQLDRGNAQPASIGADFHRLGIDIWTELRNYDQRNVSRKGMLDSLNKWRNAIAHQDFQAAALGGVTTLRLAQVQQWRRACHHLARGFDVVMGRHLQMLTGMSPW
jgi:hypothetical protein